MCHFPNSGMCDSDPRRAYSFRPRQEDQGSGCLWRRSYSPPDSSAVSPSANVGVDTWSDSVSYVSSTLKAGTPVTLCVSSSRSNARYGLQVSYVKDVVTNADSASNSLVLRDDAGSDHAFNQQVQVRT